MLTSFKEDRIGMLSNKCNSNPEEFMKLRNDHGTTSVLTTISSMLTCIDDSAVVLKKCEVKVEGCNFMRGAMSKWGFVACAGRGDKKSKIEDTRMPSITKEKGLRHQKT